MNGRQGGSEPQLNRRGILGLGMGVAAAGLLTACGGSDGGAGTPAKAKTLKLPDPVPAKSFDGEMVSKVQNVMNAYLTYPSGADRFKSVAKVPGNGGTVTAMLTSYAPPPPALSKNKWQQEFNRRIGANMKSTLINDATMEQKTQTFISSGDIPDIFNLNLGKAPATVGAIQQGAFLDLSKWISGHGDSEFPNLGRIPSISWKNSAISGGLYGVPRPEPVLASGMPLYRSDWMRRMGGSFPTNADEMFDFLTAFHTGNPTGTGQKSWAWASVSPGDQEPIMAMFGVPNVWKLEGGKLTKDIETDEYEAALEWLVKLWKSGAFHPNSASNTFEQNQDLWTSGQIGVFGYGLLSAITYLLGTPLKGAKNLVEDVAPILAPGRTGGKAGYFQGTATYGMYCIPAKHAKDDKKVRELLGILDYMAAPFGSEEYTFMNYGIEGHNFTMKDGVPTPSTNPARQAEMAANYGPTPAEISIYIPGPPNQSRKAQQYFEECTPSSVGDPTVGLITPTYVSSNAQLIRIIHDQFISIVTGRTPLASGLKGLRSQWKSSGGEKVRQEFQDALQK